MHALPVNEPPPTVHVVDGDRDLRQSLEQLVEAMGYPVRTYASASAFRREYRGHAPGCLILDAQMPGEGALAFYERLVHEGRPLPVIFTSAAPDVATAVAAMKIGAVEFLEKPLSRAVLRDRIDKALRLDRERRASDERFQRLDEQLARLNARERETLALIMSGESNKAMAARLHISERAVEMRRTRIMRKLNLRSAAELLDLAITHRVLSEIRRDADAM
jgi:FixJ family two-component response regulator